jgi:hypothetical protein
MQTQQVQLLPPMHACSFEHVMTRRAQEYGSLRHSRSFCTQPLYAPPEGEESVCPLRVQMRQAAVLQQTSLPRMHSLPGVKLCPGKLCPAKNLQQLFARQRGYISPEICTPAAFRQAGGYIFEEHSPGRGYISPPYLGGYMYPLPDVFLTRKRERICSNE